MDVGAAGGVAVAGDDFAEKKVMIAGGEAIPQATDQIRCARENPGSCRCWFDGQSRERIFFRGEALAEMFEEGGRRITHRVEDEAAGLFNQLHGRSTALKRDGHERRIEGGLLDPGDEGSGGAVLVLRGENETAAGYAPDGDGDSILDGAHFFLRRRSLGRAVRSVDGGS